ncbi:peptide deformylase [Octadecabacter sp. G9-8]|uniref:Peptide deformylase n=1 Tax=Octadecabacter dasysiphoniae TaxID=2909341 RepID=A0ABS9CZK7_9RHOB|nr:peptide deformylase [Octadecabacter dasysiphoniae]
MATRSIRLWPDPVLTQPCARIDLDDPALPDLVQDLFDTMYAAKGRGLAAPQIGVLKNVFVVDVTWKEGTPDPRAFINPRAFAVMGDDLTLDEQCLSIPGLPMQVTRLDLVELGWDNLDGSYSHAPFDGMFARCIQHEFDHLNGTVIFDHQTPDARAQLEAQYAP